MPLYACGSMPLFDGCPCSMLTRRERHMNGQAERESERETAMREDWAKEFRGVVAVNSREIDDLSRAKGANGASGSSEEFGTGVKSITRSRGEKHR